MCYWWNQVLSLLDVNRLCLYTLSVVYSLILIIINKSLKYLSHVGFNLFYFVLLLLLAELQDTSFLFVRAEFPHLRFKWKYPIIYLSSTHCQVKEYFILVLS